MSAPQYLILYESYKAGFFLLLFLVIQKAARFEKSHATVRKSLMDVVLITGTAMICFFFSVEVGISKD